MRITCIWFILVFSSAPRIFSQSSIRGTITDPDNNPVPFCIVGLLNSDSSVVKGGMSDADGKFNFELQRPGTYFLKISAAGFTDTFTQIFSVDSTGSTDLGSITLKRGSTDLDEVAVVALKKPIEFKNGNITVNVEGSPLAAGNTVYDLLMRMPGVVVDGDNISLQGKSGVRFLIDDRMQQLAGGQMVSLLKSIQASVVEKIEIINNPSSKYDASGTAGLINIVMKRVKMTGFSGDIMNASSQGFYLNSYTELSLNYKAKKLNLFSRLNYGYADFRAVNDWDRIVDYDSSQTILRQHYVEKTANRFGSCFIGGDWFINKKNTLSARIDLKPGYETVSRKSETSVSDSSLGYRNLSFLFNKPNSWFWQDYGLDFEHLFDTLGTKINFNTSYSDYPDQYDAAYENHFLNNDLQDISHASLFRSSNTVHIKVLASRLDFEKKLQKNVKLESGVKGSWQSLNSDFLFENRDPLSGDYVKDPEFTNTFDYHETILAAYANVQKDIKQFNFQLGLRAENTSVRADSRTSDFSYTRDYLNFFPSLSISYNRSEKHNFQWSYNRRITRADYNKFNPYPSFRSILTKVQGNPYLKPMYTNNFQFTYSFRGKIIQTLGYSGSDNYFLEYNKQNNATKELIFFTGNLKRSESYSYSLYIQHDLKRWWNTTVWGGCYYNRFYGELEGLYYSTSGISSNAGCVNLFSVSKTTKLEITTFIIGPWLDGVLRYKTRGGVNLGIRQSLLKDKLTLSFGVLDLTYSNGVRSVINYTGQYSESSHRWDSRRVYISLSYNFGKIKVEQKTVKDDDEEKSRLKR